MKAALSSYRDNQVDGPLDQDMAGINQGDIVISDENLRLNNSERGDFNGRGESGEYIAFSTL